MEQKNWINEVFDSTKGMHKAEPSPFLFEQITAKISNGTTKPSLYGSPFLRWGLAVFVSTIISLNIISLLKANHIGTESANEKMTSPSSYFNNATTYNY